MKVILTYIDDNGVEHSEPREISDIDSDLNFNYTIFGPESEYVMPSTTYVLDDYDK